MSVYVKGKTLIKTKKRAAEFKGGKALLGLKGT